MGFIKSLFIIAFIVVVAAFATLNSNIVLISYHFGEFNMPLSLLLLVTFLLGMFLAMLFFITSYLKLKTKISKLNWQIKKTREN